ncbi:ash family protein [Acerihabitans sp. TG2]|uniref:ash family protein n=1 Tax=Acerihabitans sp. TG2 TaxID=3096008 RepID=UPI002B236BA4|nr:ash family protein [Acerihabitans sp. TG2]MEA9393417.1 ash family protein [Acerihabitans sp. TG2]
MPLQKNLFSHEPVGYSFRAVAKSTAGRGNPSSILATKHAPRVFFYVAALICRFFAQRYVSRCRSLTMVAQAGLTSVRPVPKVAGISTSVWATTHKRGNFGGSCYQLTMEAAIMATTLAHSHSAFTFIFAAVRRSVPNSHRCMVYPIEIHILDARQTLDRGYVLPFVGRPPIQEVA